jgi:hypothetical protein
MKRFGLATILALTLFPAGQTGWADQKAIPGTRHGNPHNTTATEMTLLGLAAGTVLGFGAYLVRRQRI